MGEVQSCLARCAENTKGARGGNLSATRRRTAPGDETVRRHTTLSLNMRTALTADSLKVYILKYIDDVERAKEAHGTGMVTDSRADVGNKAVKIVQGVSKWRERDDGATKALVLIAMFISVPDADDEEWSDSDGEGGDYNDTDGPAVSREGETKAERELRLETRLRRGLKTEAMARVRRVYCRFRDTPDAIQQRADVTPGEVDVLRWLDQDTTFCFKTELARREG